MADLTETGVKSLKTAISLIREHKANRIDLGHETIVYKVPSSQKDKYTIRIDMKFDESEDK